MRAELKSIQSNDYVKWEDFAAAPRAEPWDDSGWFTVEIGPDDGIQSGEMFQVLVATAASVARIKPARGQLRCVVTGAFEPEVIVSTLRENLAGISASSWEEIREQLRKFMWWEWEDMKATK